MNAFKFGQYVAVKLAQEQLSPDAVNNMAATNKLLRSPEPLPAPAPPPRPKPAPAPAAATRVPPLPSAPINVDNKTPADYDREYAEWRATQQPSPPINRGAAFVGNAARATK